MSDYSFAGIATDPELKLFKQQSFPGGDSELSRAGDCKVVDIGVKAEMQFDDGEHDNGVLTDPMQEAIKETRDHFGKMPLGGYLLPLEESILEEDDYA
jgi:hypothetical protein